MLHITNGDSAAETIKDAVFSGQILAWRDVLHEGPVPAGLHLPQLSEIRTEFIAGLDWGAKEAIALVFHERDQTLARFREHEEIVLWFEHDLYDQLQLIQILDWFFERECGATKLSLICIGEHHEVQPFHGLGELNVNQMAALLPLRHIISYKEKKTAHLAWQAFTSPDPTNIEKLLATDTSALPFLKKALLRHLQQFPSTTNGLGRTEQQILTAVAHGKQTPQEIFLADQAQEENVFMGDASFWIYLHTLCSGKEPLLQTRNGATFFLPEAETDVPFVEQKLILTEAGKTVLAGTTDQIKLNGIERWFGGVHLQGNDVQWRWEGNNLLHFAG